MRVWRVEDATGKGPYGHGYIDGDVTPRHPLPYEDGIENVLPSYVFGFLNLEQLKGWFSSTVRATLADKGFGISVYEIQAGRIRKGGRQVAFDRGDHKPHRKIDLVSFKGRKRTSAKHKG